MPTETKKTEGAAAAADVIMIQTDLITPHPNNPRKDLGDLTELTDSIRKQGIMQNLTVVPGILPDGREGYTALIGHRRLAAAKLAGLKAVPCSVVRGLTDAEELSIMLEENMQRNDLTITEQAQSFQLLMDLGETEDSIAEKTGFSRTTVRRRLFVAKLDQNILEKKMSNTEFQISFGDLYALEEVKDIKARNRILNEANSSENLKWRITQYITDLKRKEAKEKYTAKLNKAGAKEVPKTPNASKFENVLTLWISAADLGESKKLDKILKKPDGIIYTSSSYSIEVYRPWPDGKRPLTDYEKEQKEKEARAKTIRTLHKQLVEEQRLFIVGLILNGKKQGTDGPDPAESMRQLWELMLKTGAVASRNYLISVCTGKNAYDLEKEKKEKILADVQKTDVVYQMMAMVWEANRSDAPIDWNGRYREDRGKPMIEFYNILKEYGFSCSGQEHTEVIEGTHEAYTAPEKEDK